MAGRERRGTRERDIGTRGNRRTERRGKRGEGRESSTAETKGGRDEGRNMDKGTLGRGKSDNITPSFKASCRGNEGVDHVALKSEILCLL